MNRDDKFLTVNCEALEWITPRRSSETVPRIRYRKVLAGDEALPDIHMTQYLPNWSEPRHRHAEDEVLLIFEGELQVDGTIYKAPTAIFVGRGTLYGPLTAGPKGATFFRVAGRRLSLKQQN